MGRPKASPTTQVSQQPQEYHSHSVSQSPDTIDDAVPPPSETCNNENQPGIEPSEIPNENEKNNQHSYQPQQQAHSIPQAAIFNNQTQATTPLPFPPQTSQTNVYHFPPENHQMRSPTGAASLQPPQPNPQVFPPSQDEPQAFPPQADPKPQAFPPPQGEPQAFPPPQGNPQAFPPHEADQNPQAFPPPQGEPQAFPHPQGKPQAFPPPQAFPQQATIFQQQQQNGMQFPQNGNFYHPSSTVSGQMGVQNAMPHSPFHPTPQNMMNNATPGFPVINQNPIIQVPTEDWKTGLFECMNDPTNALVTACFPCVTFGQIAEIIDSGQTSCGTSGLLYGVIACVIAMPCLISCTYRTKLRGRFGLIETPAPDWVIHCFCEYCALCQEYRELKERGLDPSIGWLGNLNKQKQMAQLAAMSPPMRQTMMGH